MLRLIALGGIFMVPFVPLIVAPHMFFPFITGKNFAFRIIVEITATAWLLLALRNKGYRLGRSAVLTTMGIFVLVVTIADLLGVSVQTSIWSNFERMEGLVTILHLAVYVLVTGSILNSMKLWDKFFYTSIGVSLFLSMYGYLQLAGALQINQGGVRLDGTLGNATYMGIYMLFNMYLLLMLFFRRTKHFSREALVSYFIGGGWFLLFLMHVGVSDNVHMGKDMYILGVISVAVLFGAGYLWKQRKIMEKQWVQYVVTGGIFLLQVTTLYYTATRGAILGLLGGLLLTALLIAFFEKSRRRLRQVALAGIILLFLGLGGFLLIKDADFVTHSPVLSRFTNLSFREVGSRSMVWQMALKGIQERPILGWGQNNFDIVFNKYYDPRMYSQEPWFDRAHNIILDWTISAGVVGLVSYLSLFGVTLFVLWKDTRKKFTLVDKSLLTGMLAGYLFHNLFVFDNIVSYVLFFSILAYVHTMESFPRERGVWTWIEVKRVVVDSTVAPVLCIILGVTVYVINVRPMFAASILIDAIIPQEKGITQNFEKFKKVFAYNTIGAIEAREQLLQLTLQVIASSQPSQEVKQNFFTLTMEQFDKQLKETPLSTRHYYFLGAFLRAINKPDAGVPLLAQAHELSPRKQIITMELATALSELKEDEKALEFFREAFKLEEKNDQARVFYASFAQQIGKETIAKEILEERFGTILVPERQMILAYLKTGRTDLVVRIWEKLAEVNKEENQLVKVKTTLAAAYYVDGQLGRAIKEIESAIKLDPNFKEQGEAKIQDMRAGKQIDVESTFFVWAGLRVR
ncbi:MAG: Lipid A core--O-antigen ligase-like protein [Parcubacteria group bacterium Gr01-1014_48]|nr:MAG: Lipid A core--O-antigen ligase-like protein [Parcubacteria group bacterium Greene0416_14]TSC72332.1 MAG: Lipid A core--O-antigen ligase-like protein [Parcubacteria group bacterium Gr01-1014_48]TSD01750.1 MAG: Lipid A core--O-antigen ligase-like protein [Parcubacteria group bacterium Greene1014_15]TSD08464.1 MAG: Lipid A core--O-antigen ligase-like protein [Parcubacteria group bacterium Greene0714_4]